MNLSISDDFDLQKIAHSGQCFCVRKFGDEFFRFVTGNEVLCIQERSAGCFEISYSLFIMRYRTKSSLRIKKVLGATCAVRLSLDRMVKNSLELVDFREFTLCNAILSQEMSAYA